MVLSFDIETLIRTEKGNRFYDPNEKQDKQQIIFFIVFWDDYNDSDNLASASGK